MDLKKKLTSFLFTGLVCSTTLPALAANEITQTNTPANQPRSLPPLVDLEKRPVAAVENDNTVASFASQAMVGLMFDLSKSISIDTGYRYFNGGEFKSDDYIASSVYAATAAPPWTGTLQSNEVFLELNMRFS